MIYFDNDTKHALVNRFYDASNPGAYLLIGQSETLAKGETKYTYISPATYKKAEN
jgi:chemotaxis protein methyltransferase CheR